MCFRFALLRLKMKSQKIQPIIKRLNHWKEQNRQGKKTNEKCKTCKYNDKRAGVNQIDIILKSMNTMCFLIDAFQKIIRVERK